MAFRKIECGFWQDEKIIEDFTPEDKLFYLYLMTNSQTKQIGVYKLIKKISAVELGYSTDTVSSLIDRFERLHKLIKYNKDTREICILNWGKYNLNRGGKPVYDLITKELKDVKDKSLISLIIENSDSMINDGLLSIMHNYLDEDGFEKPTNRDTNRESIRRQEERRKKKEERIKNKEERIKKKDNTTEIIFEYWNTKNIVVHQKITAKIKAKIETALSQYSIDEIKNGIDRYKTMLQDETWTYCQYKWGLIEFLGREKGIDLFLDDGSKWINYCDFLDNKNRFNNTNNTNNNQESDIDQLKRLREQAIQREQEKERGII